MRCSMPESGAVLPAAPMARPEAVRRRASRVRAVSSPWRSAGAAASSVSPRGRNRSTIAGSNDSSTPVMAASRQSAGAVNMDIISPKPAAVIAGGAAARIFVSITSAAGQVEVTVRLTPSLRMTAMPSAKPLTEAAVCTATSGTPAERRRLLADVGDRAGTDADQAARAGGGFRRSVESGGVDMEGAIRRLRERRGAPSRPVSSSPATSGFSASAPRFIGVASSRITIRSDRREARHRAGEGIERRRAEHDGAEADRARAPARFGDTASGFELRVDRVGAHRGGAPWPKVGSRASKAWR